MRWLALLALASWQQTPVIRVPVRLVTVPVLVVNGEGACAAGLNASDFTLFDEDRPQRFQLDTEYLPPSVAVVVQANADVRRYLPFVAKVGGALDDLLVGETGRSALVTYDDFVTVRKAFDERGLREVLPHIVYGGKRARLFDAAIEALDRLEREPASRARVLLLIGQPMDRGSEAKLDAVEERAERDGVTVFALALPELDRAFVEDSFALEALSSRTDRGGFRASVDLMRLAPALAHAAAADTGADPFTRWTRSTGGTLLHFRSQRVLEGALGMIGTEMRSFYTLSFVPDLPRAGYHRLAVEVKLPGATAYARPGYRWGE